MDIKMKDIPAPMVTSFAVFGGPDIDLLLREGVLTVEARQQTKTRVSTSIKFGNYFATINWKLEGFKTDYKKTWNAIHSAYHEHHYFKIGKWQGRAEYNDYIYGIITKLMKQWGIYDQMDQLLIQVIDKVEWP